MTLTPTLDATLPKLPAPRGELSEALIGALAEPAHAAGLPSPQAGADPLADEDLQLSLYLLYELHYRDFDGVSADWEWNGSLLETRGALEAIYGAALAALVPTARRRRPTASARRCSSSPSPTRVRRSPATSRRRAPPSRCASS